MSFNPAQHPRAPAGAAGGGRFVAAGSQGAAAEGVKKKLGKLTKKRIEEYQKSHGLKVDGIVGRQTAAALLGHKDAKHTKVGSLTSSQIKLLSHHGRGKRKRHHYP